MKKVQFAIGEYFHVFNRGIDKRDIFSDRYDVSRFLQSMDEFNCVEAGNDIFFSNKNKKSKKVDHRKASHRKDNQNREKLVNIVCFCLNPNHFHLVLKELVEGGVSEFMKRLGGGYTQAFNLKYKRSGVLFQGRFKVVHIESNEQLLHVSSYVNLNNKVHKKFESVKKHFLDSIPNRSSWNEYIKEDNYFYLCNKNIILDQFKNKEDYKKITEETIKNIKEKRYED